MINRASVQCGGIAGQPAGPPKSAGKKSYRCYFWSGATDPILSTQRIPRGRDPILSTQRIGAARIRLYLHKPNVS